MDGFHFDGRVPGARGYGMDEASIRVKLDGNDLPNVDLVLSGSVSADFRVRNA